MKQNLLICLLLIFSSALMSQTIFVKHDAAGANNGSSWTDAYTTLDAALAAATPGTQIWVSAGTYKPDAGTANNSFWLQAGVELYGGFNGTEATLSARNPATNVTILSGDLSGDDVTGDFTMNRTDNSRHVIAMLAGTSMGDRARVDGFTIQGGNTLVATTDPDSSRRGGGMLATELVTVNNCRFTDNFAASGAGIMVLGTNASGALINNCLFENNAATANGAGAYLFNVLSGDVNNCVFKNNATNSGTLTVRTAAGITIDSCLIESNTAPGNFCAGLFTFTTQSTVTNTTIKGNTAGTAAGWYNDGRVGGDMLTAENCLIENNTAAGYGGGFYNWQGTYSLKNTTFRDNVAANAAGMYNDGREFDSQFSIENCVFEGNVTNDYGGSGIYAWKSNFVMSNTTFRQNTAPNSAAAIYNGDSTVFVIEQCRFDTNSAGFGGAIANYGGGLDGVYKNCTFTGNSATTSGGAINNGFTSKTSYVDCEFDDNQARFGGAISNQNEITQISITGGRFFKNSAADNGGAVNLGSGITLNANGALFEENSAAFGGAVSTLGEGNIGNYRNCQFLSNTAVTSGGALINGFLAYNSVDSCHFEGNSASFGGGVFCQNDSTGIDIRNSTFLGNNADNNGGGVNIGAGIVSTIENTVFELNTADIGGGMEISEDSLDLAVSTINNCTFQDNFAFTQGAGLNLSNADVTITNSLFARNQNFGDGAGGAISNNTSAGDATSVRIINSTIVDNTAAIGAGIAQWEDPSGADAVLDLQNTILANSAAGLDYEIEDGMPAVTSSGGNLSSDATLAAVLTATNDLTSSDPLFVDAASFDYHLQPNSPCIDKGIAAGAPVLDLDGNPRQGPPDMGCFEWGTIATHIPGANVLPLKLMPNPTVEHAVLVLENEWSGDARVQIVAQNGALVSSFTATKTSGRWVQTLDVRNLPAGVYSVQVLLGTAYHEGSLVKK